MNKFEKQFKHACWLHTQHFIHRYLMSNADGRLDGAEKAHRHRQLCSFYVAVVFGIEEDEVHKEFKTLDAYNKIHEETSELTDYMDEQIGFPLKGRPDYDKLVPLFFDKFHSLAMKSLSDFKKHHGI